MHELGIAKNILEIVRQSVPENRLNSVIYVRIRVGQLSGVVPASLDFCFSAIVNETSMRRARLDIVQVPIVSLCKDCSQNFQIEDLAFFCPVCRSTNLELISGRELEVAEIELSDDNDEEI
jgi:hydrogenase nickel incorporation protein HypA/HybF